MIQSRIILLREKIRKLRRDWDESSPTQRMYEVLILSIAKSIIETPSTLLTNQVWDIDNRAISKVMNHIGDIVLYKAITHNHTKMYRFKIK
jgi:hypothetical protein